MKKAAMKQAWKKSDASSLSSASVMMALCTCENYVHSLLLNLLA
jgi:hypothetical protein